VSRHHLIIRVLSAHPLSVRLTQRGKQPTLVYRRDDLAQIGWLAHEQEQDQPQPQAADTYGEGADAAKAPPAAAAASAPPPSLDAFLQSLPSSVHSQLQHEVLSLIFPNKTSHPPHLYRNLPGPLPISITRSHLQNLQQNGYWCVSSARTQNSKRAPARTAHAEEYAHHQLRLTLSLLFVFPVPSAAAAAAGLVSGRAKRVTVSVQCCT